MRHSFCRKQFIVGLCHRSAFMFANSFRKCINTHMMYVGCMIVIEHCNWTNIDPLQFWDSHHTGRDRSKWLLKVFQISFEQQFSSKWRLDLDRERGLVWMWHMGGRRNVLDCTPKYHLTTHTHTLLYTILSHCEYHACYNHMHTK